MKLAGKTDVGRVRQDNQDDYRAGELPGDAANVRRFQQKLESLGVNATVRRRLGSEISAACGQLRRDEMNGKA